MVINNQPMTEDIIKIRAALFAVIRSGERKNRRALLVAYKHIDKAARALGAPKMDVPKRTSTEPVYEYQPEEVEEVEEPSLLLATNAPDEQPGPEKPRRKTKKA